MKEVESDLSELNNEELIDERNYYQGDVDGWDEAISEVACETRWGNDNPHLSREISRLTRLKEAAQYAVWELNEEIKRRGIKE